MVVVEKKEVTTTFENEAVLRSLMRTYKFKVRSSEALPGGKVVKCEVDLDAATATPKDRIKWICKSCDLHLKSNRLLDGTWLVRSDFVPADHKCYNKEQQEGVMIHYQANLTEKQLEDIRMYTMYKHFQSAQIQAQMKAVHNVWVDVQLIYRIGDQARKLMLGSSGDTLHLRALQATRQQMGDTFDMEYDDSGHLW